MNKKIANEIAIGMVISLSIIIGLIFWQSQKQAYRNDYRKAEIVQQPLIYSFYNNIKKDNMQFAENKNSETIIRKICEKFPVNKKIQTWVDNEGVAKFFQINNEISSDDEIFYLLDLKEKKF